MITSFKRRQFLAGLGAASGVIALDAIAPQVLCMAAAQPSLHDRVLVVVEMAGGNDGLNTVVPLSDPAYRSARPNLAIAKADCLAIDSDFGFHPALKGFSKLLDQNRLAIVRGVGYPNPNRSHFESMDIWHSCQRKDQPRYDGWLGRYLETRKLGDDPPALHLGAEKQPFALMSRDVRVPSVESLADFRLRDNGSVDLAQSIQQIATETEDNPNDLLGFVQQSTSSAVKASQRLGAVQLEAENTAGYPQTTLGNKMAMIAKLIRSGMQTHVYYVRIDGFDTHANQPDAHAALLGEVGDAVDALIDDLSRQGEDQRVSVMCFSEFGRRVAENASDGTDHGTAGPLFVAGGAVHAGLLGNSPNLEDLEQGDLKYTIDFRSVYASLLQWMGCTENETILQGRFEPVALFG